MQIRETWIRFYKSFNYDYELKAHPNSTKKDWQSTPDGWLPHVRIPLEPDITAVVGANESGKSHLLDAINIVLTGNGLRQRDFCRYSSLFSVERDQRLYPEVGATFELAETDVDALTDANVPLLANGQLLMLRPEPTVIHVVNSEEKRVPLNSEQRDVVEELLPHAFHLRTQVDLPDSVSIAALANKASPLASRRKRVKLLASLMGLDTAEAITAQAATLFTILSEIDAAENERQELGRLLLTKVACIEESSFAELHEAIAEEREGLVNGLIQEMNKSIARHLNISRWWSQDADFQLRISPREHELVFTIRDRTGTDYSFTERSRGLTYFLSYFVQLRSHDRPTDRPEVLLMDEPDAYLSALGQQDLLRVLEDHAHPEDSDRTDQIVYVTHSPFLINRNAGHRVRVVDKGTRDEGTRLVKDATQNHYEPLRTSLGGFVAETAFIGGDNLFIEGISDQVLLAGMNARLRRAGTPPSECLDLNQVTLVPGGSNVPYMLYLARGRDQFKPACAVLLDGDKAGKDAQAQIKKGGARGRPTVSDDLIVLLSDWATEAGAKAEEGVTIEEPEDLVPLSLAGVAARRYAQHVLGLSETDTLTLADESIRANIDDSNYSMWDAIDAAFNDAFGTRIGKAGFAKELLAYLAEHEHDDTPPDGAHTLDANYKPLLNKLAQTLRLAREREENIRRDQRVERIIEAFTEDHPTGCIRDKANIMLKRIEAATDDTAAGDVIRAGTSRLRRSYDLSVDPLSRVTDYEDFLSELQALPTQVRLAEKGRLGDVVETTTGRANSSSTTGIDAAITLDVGREPR
ncbi:ATP-binding protein [Amycolatopsis magusensis]|uniref:AAA family ATPase n=1 Tax=Amycolatopsis magusensis TaxID=882444 RepID=UPI003C2B70C9